MSDTDALVKEAPTSTIQEFGGDQSVNGQGEQEEERPCYRGSRVNDGSRSMFRPFVYENADLNTPFSFEQRLSSSPRDTIDWAANFNPSRYSGARRGGNQSSNAGARGAAARSPTTPTEVQFTNASRQQQQSYKVGAPTDWTHGTALNLGSDGCKRFHFGGSSREGEEGACSNSSSKNTTSATCFVGWGGSLESSIWPPVLRPSYRLLAGGRIAPGLLEVGSMLTLEKTYKPCALDLSVSSPQALGIHSHTRFDHDLIHSSFFWTPRWARPGGGTRGSSGSPDDTNNNSSRSEVQETPPGEPQRSCCPSRTNVDEFVPTARWGLGVTLKRDMASGVNLLLGHARDIGEVSHFTAHTDVLRRFCATFRTSFFEGEKLTIGTRLRMNLITLHDTMLDVGMSYKLHGDAVKLRLSHTTAGNSLGLQIASVPSTLRDPKVSAWLPNWLVKNSLLDLGDFDATMGLTWSHPLWSLNPPPVAPTPATTTPRGYNTPHGPENNNQAAVAGPSTVADPSASTTGSFSRRMNLFFSVTAR